MEGLLGKAMFTGIINFTLILINIMVVTVMWQKAGVPFNGAYTVVVLGSLVGTLLAVYYRVAVAVAPADAAWQVKEAASYISPCAGGHGVARDIIERVLTAQGMWMDDEHAFGW